MLLVDYYEKWIYENKEGFVREVTVEKYKNTLSWLKKLVPELHIENITKRTFQMILNEYAETHEKTTVRDFCKQVKAGILDAKDEGLIDIDPTRRVVIKGKAPREKKKKYLSEGEVKRLVSDFSLPDNEINKDWFLLMLLKTGMRFAEGLAITKGDIDFESRSLRISKTWNYKGSGGFMSTKNHSSIRTITLDSAFNERLRTLTSEMNDEDLLFIVDGVAIHNSTYNNVLARHCINAGVPPITLHGLRHTHASLLMYMGVSILNISKRLGHSKIGTTQKVYLHIIKELEQRDSLLLRKVLSELTDDL